MQQPLPTPFQLCSRLILIVSEQAKCTGAWAQHPGPLTIDELISIEQSVRRYLRTVLEDHFEAVAK